VQRELVTLTVVAGPANARLGEAVAAGLSCGATACRVERYPDGELRPAVANVRGDDVYVVQPTGPPVNDHVVELLLLIDACRRAGADRITAVVPYFGYARQDRRGRTGDAVGARVVADAIAAAGAHRLVVIDPHTPALEAMCSIPVDMLTAVPLLADALRRAAPPDAVVVAPDLGAVKLAERYAALLARPVAVVRKTRVSGTTVSADELIGDVENRPVVIVDDMISTGGTIEAAGRVVRERGAVRGLSVAASHGLLVAGAADRLVACGVERLVVTDTVPVDDALGRSVDVQSVAVLLADAIGRIHGHGDLTGLLAHT
jgi:ribose-phosphate pyrophosphokinase